MFVLAEQTRGYEKEKDNEKREKYTQVVLQVHYGHSTPEYAPLLVDIDGEIGYGDDDLYADNVDEDKPHKKGLEKDSVDEHKPDQKGLEKDNADKIESSV